MSSSAVTDPAHSTACCSVMGMPVEEKRVNRTLRDKEESEKPRGDAKAKRRQAVSSEATEGQRAEDDN